MINDVELGWTVDDAGHSIPVEFDARDYTYYRQRYGAGGQLDYRFRKGPAYVRGLFSLFKNWGRVTATTSAPTESKMSTAPLPREPTLAPRARCRSGVHGAAVWRHGGRCEDIGWLDFNVALNYAGTRQSVSDYRTSPFKYSGNDLSGLALDASNPQVPVYHYLNATDADNAVNPQNYRLSRYTTSDGLTTGRDLGGQLDATWHYSRSARPAR